MKKALIIAVCIVAAVFAGGYSVYRFYVIPHYLEPAAEKAADIINSEEMKAKVDGLVAELVESGRLSEEEAKKYTDAAGVSESKTDETTGEANDETAEDVQTDVSEQTAEGNTDSADTKSEESSSEEETDNRSAYEKVVSEMEPEDLKEAYDLYSQYSDMAGMSTEELKEYAKENMSPEEIQQALELYSKYAGLLK